MLRVAIYFRVGNKDQVDDNFLKRIQRLNTINRKQELNIDTKKLIRRDLEC